MHTSLSAMTETGFLNRPVSLRGVDYRCQIYLPPGYTRDRSWPVILFLHGVGESGDDGLRPTEVGLGTAIRRHAERFPCIVVFPQARPGCRAWRGEAAAAALHALDQAAAEFNVDPRRVYLTGLSMGANGAIELAARNPGTFAALVPVSTDIDESTEPDAVPALASAIGKTPVWLFQGGEDTETSVAATRRLYRHLQTLAGQVRYTEYPRTGHGAWDPAYAEPELIPWLLAQRRAT